MRQTCHYVSTDTMLDELDLWPGDMVTVGGRERWLVTGLGTLERMPDSRRPILGQKPRPKPIVTPQPAILREAS